MLSGLVAVTILPTPPPSPLKQLYQRMFRIEEKGEGGGWRGREGGGWRGGKGVVHTTVPPP